MFGSTAFSTGLQADERLHIKAPTTVQSPFGVCLSNIAITSCKSIINFSFKTECIALHASVAVKSAKRLPPSLLFFHRL